MLTDGRIDEALGHFRKYANAPKKWPCYGQSLAFHSAVLGSIPNKSMLDLWWDKWHQDISLSTWLGFPMTVSFQECSKFILQAATNNAVQHQRMPSSLTKILPSRSLSVSLQETQQNYFKFLIKTDLTRGVKKLHLCFYDTYQQSAI